MKRLTRYKYKRLPKLRFVLVSFAALTLVGLAVQFALAVRRPPDPPSLIDIWAAQVDPAQVVEVRAIQWDIEVGVWIPRDQRGKYINFQNGYRVTPGQPERFANSIYLFGNSEMLGQFVDDSSAIAAALQRLMPAARIVNVGITGVVAQAQVARLRTVPLQDGDIVVFMDGVQDIDGILFGTAPDSAIRDYVKAIATASAYCRARGVGFYHFRQPVLWTHGTTYLGLAALYERYWQDLPGAWLQVPDNQFIDFAHTTERGNAIVARAIYDTITIY